jgi:hypothetical protein
MSGIHSTLRIHLAADSGHYFGIEIQTCLGATAALITEITFPKLLGRFENSIWYHNL